MDYVITRWQRHLGVLFPRVGLVGFCGRSTPMQPTRSHRRPRPPPRRPPHPPFSPTTTFAAVEHHEHYNRRIYFAQWPRCRRMDHVHTQVAAVTAQRSAGTSTNTNHQSAGGVAKGRILTYEMSTPTTINSILDRPPHRRPPRMHPFSRIQHRPEHCRDQPRVP